MLFVKRNLEGQITAIFNHSNEPNTQELDSTNPEVVRFLFNEETPGSLLSAQLDEIRLSDLGLIRVIEDLVGVLVDKKVISITDLPEAAITRLRRRQTMRSRLESISQILNSEEVGK